MGGRRGREGLERGTSGDVTVEKVVSIRLNFGGKFYRVTNKWALGSWAHV